MLPASLAVRCTTRNVLTRSYPEIIYPHDSEHECDRTIGSFGHQSEITREQLPRLPLPPGRHSWHPMRYGSSRVSTSGLSAGHLMTTMKYSDRHLAGLSARPPGPRRTHRRGLSRLRDRPQLRLRLRANKLPSPNHCGESRDVLLVFKNLSRSLADTEKKQQKRKQQRKEAFAHHPARDTLKKKERKQTSQGRDGRTARRHHTGNFAFFSVQVQEHLEHLECKVTAHPGPGSCHGFFFSSLRVHHCVCHDPLHGDAPPLVCRPQGRRRWRRRCRRGLLRHACCRVSEQGRRLRRDPKLDICNQRLLHGYAREVHEAQRVHLLLPRRVGPREALLGRLPREGARRDRPSDGGRRERT